MIEIKRDSYLALFYIAALAAAVYLVATGKATLREVSAFLAGSSLVPALVHRKSSPSPLSESSRAKNATVEPSTIPVTVEDEQKDVAEKNES